MGEKSFADNILMRNFAGVRRLFYLASAPWQYRKQTAV